jgi:hypothetical protein
MQTFAYHEGIENMATAQTDQDEDFHTNRCMASTATMTTWAMRIIASILRESKSFK